MESLFKLSPHLLCTRCDPASFSFNTTDELELTNEIIGQDRAVEAVQFGVDINQSGYNLYVMGPAGSGKHSMVRQFLESRAHDEVTPDDWCYVNNFELPHKPKAIRLPHGMGAQLKQSMEHLIEELSTSLPAAFESEEYRNHHQSIEEDLKSKQENAFARLSKEASDREIKLFRTPSGFAFAPLHDGEVLDPESFNKLPDEQRAKIEQIVNNLQDELQNILQQIPLWRKESKEKIRALNKDVTIAAVGHLIEEIRKNFGTYDSIGDYLTAVETDIIDNVTDFLPSEDNAADAMESSDPKLLHRYKVNNLVINKQGDGAPVVYLDNPTYMNLIGRAEHISQYGTLITDFTLIKPGALHTANGGYLILDAEKMLTQPYAWEGLKRALHSMSITIESLEKMLSLGSSVSLEPEPIPLNIKILILGSREVYYLLHELDSEFPELFKVQVDLAEYIHKNDDNNLLFARLLATLAKRDGLLPLETTAIAAIIDHASRIQEDSSKLTTHMRSIADILHESHYWAKKAEHTLITDKDVYKAVQHRIYRASRVNEQILEAIINGDIAVDTQCSVIGQINGLSVFSLGENSFGQPTRITATTHIGDGDLIDIEREVELGGAIHSKGVLILSAFIASRYAQHQPLALSASLVFEQSYGLVDGDSASMAELCALLSSLAATPINQAIAMTGSVNQHGFSQPIGGVNFKIEGFYQVCKAHGLTGKQGVIIPKTNLRHLMLNQDVIDAVEKGDFSIYAIDKVDEAMEILTGVLMGTADADGHYPVGTLNYTIMKRLGDMAKIRHNFGDNLKESNEV